MLWKVTWPTSLLYIYMLHVQLSLSADLGLTINWSDSNSLLCLLLHGVRSRIRDKKTEQTQRRLQLSKKIPYLRATRG